MQAGYVSFQEVKQAVSLEAVLGRYGLLADLVPKGANLAGACPFCKGKSSRPFQASLGKNAWYCFGCKTGGNVLDFVAKSEGVNVRAAALSLDRWFGLGLAAGGAPAPPAEASAEDAAPAGATTTPRANLPLTFTLKTLDPTHPSLASLGFEASVLESLGAGYCGRGLLKGRLAIPIHGAAGDLLAYAGRALEDDTSPRYLFPENFHPELEVFNLHRLADADTSRPLHLAPDLDGALRLVTDGEPGALALFDGSLSAEQEDALAGALSVRERLVLVGEGFADCTVARLARRAENLAWIIHPLGAPAAPDSDQP